MRYGSGRTRGQVERERVWRAVEERLGWSGRGTYSDGEVIVRSRNKTSLTEFAHMTEYVGLLLGSLLYGALPYVTLLGVFLTAMGRETDANSKKFRSGTHTATLHSHKWDNGHIRQLSSF